MITIFKKQIQLTLDFSTPLKGSIAVATKTLCSLTQVMAHNELILGTPGVSILYDLLANNYAQYALETIEVPPTWIIIQGFELKGKANRKE